MPSFRAFRRRVLLFVMKAVKHRKRPFFPGNIPVVLVENIGRSVSATGKSLFIEALAKGLADHGLKVDVCISRKSVRQTVLLSNEGKRSSAVSSEDFLMSRNVQTWIGKNVVDSIVASAENGANIAIVEGALEGSGVIPNFLIALIDSDSINGTFSGSVFHKLTHSDAIVTLGDCEANDIHQFHRVVYRTRWQLDTEKIHEKKILGFSSIDCSGVFYRLLTQHSSNISGFIPLLYKNNEKHFNKILHIANSQKAQLVTTDRDPLSQKMKKHVQTCPLKVVIESPLIQEILRVCVSSVSTDNFSVSTAKTSAKYTK